MAGAATSSASRYQECVGAIAAAPESVLQLALAWQQEGGGAAAEHCVALALVALKRPGEAAVRLDHLAQTAIAKNRASLFAQSGNAWLLAGQADKAEAALSSALAAAPGDVDVLIDRARARAMRKNWAGAESDLSQAYQLNNKRPDVLVLRASARSALGRKDQAKADIDAALAIDANFPDALLERGAMKMAAGDKSGARADWQQVLARAPNSAAGQAARKYMRELDAPPAPAPSPAPSTKPPDKQ